nr:DUF551 domain-containing protein [Cronobacter malonaticus]
MLTERVLSVLALRERAEPVAWTEKCEITNMKATGLYLRGFPDSSQGRDIPLYTAPPAPVVPKIDRKAICNKAHWLCARSPGATFYNAAEFALDEVMELLAPPAPVAAEPVSPPYKLPDGWIACSEQLPEREYVLAADFSGAYYPPSLPNTQVGIYADWFEDGNPSWDDGDGNDLHLKQVTHWMPLPEAPGKGE